MTEELSHVSVRLRMQQVLVARLVFKSIFRESSLFSRERTLPSRTDGSNNWNGLAVS